MIKTSIALFLFLTLIIQLNGQNKKIEAEEAELKGVSVDQQLSGYSGTGYVTGFDQDGDKVVFTFQNEIKGKYQLLIGYAAIYGNKNNYVYINNNNIGNLLFKKTDGFTELNAGKIYLEEGINTISIEKSWGWFFLDYIRFDNAIADTPWNISKLPVNTKASFEVKALKAFLYNHFGKTTFAGQFLAEEKSYNDTNSELTYIFNQTGKYPALYGNDLIDYSPSRIQFGSSSKTIEDVMNWYNAYGGMITLTWHWNAPIDLYNTNENPWWSGFYTRATSFDIAAVLANPNGEKYKLLIRDIDAIAEQLKRLQAMNIPVLWRPLHEAEGAWFWWGAKGSDACVALWRLLYERLTNYHQINNLLWVWTTYDSDESLRWYPGDDFVDILGVDVYLNPGDYGTSSTLFDKLRTMFNGKKMLTMSENGSIPNPDKMYEYGAYWLYFCTWTGNYILNNQNNSTEHLNTIFKHEKITTLDELPKNWLNTTWNAQTPTSNERSLVEIYPNPFYNEINLSFPSVLFLHISIFDCAGNNILTYSSVRNSNKITISLQHLPPGIYYLQCINNETMETHKIIKQ